MAEFILEYGYLALSILSFIGASIFPLSSEAAVLIALEVGLEPVEVVIFASIGNCLACLLNYYLGFWFAKQMQQKLLDTKSGKLADKWLSKWGYPALLLSWLPVVGDPITIMAGIGRLNLVYFSLIVFGLRIARYLTLAGFY